MRILCLGYQSIGHMGLGYFLEETQDEVVALFTHEDAPGEEVWWESAAELAQRHGVPVYTPADINQPESVDLIRSLAPDFIFSFWYRNLVGRCILDLAPQRCLNLHGSLLPRYRGRAPVNWVLVNGERKTGITLHHMVPRADAGDIVGQAVVPITQEDTALTLYRKLVDMGREVLRATWPLLRAGTAPRVPQDERQATYVGRRTPEDGIFSWSWPADRIHDLVRAVTHPYPGAFTWVAGRKLFVWSAWPLAGLVHPNPPAPGTVLAVEADGVRVATGEGALLLRTLQVEGEPEFDGRQFAARYGLRPGQALTVE